MSKKNFNNYDTNSIDDIFYELGLDLMRINNLIYPKLHSENIICKNKDMELLIQIYSELKETQKTIMCKIRGEI